MKASDVKAGMTAIFVPDHAHGARSHPDCEQVKVLNTCTLEGYVAIKRVRDGGEFVVRVWNLWPWEACT